MPFMKPQIVHGKWYCVAGPIGTEWIPADIVGIPKLVHSHFSTNHGNLMHLDCPICKIYKGDFNPPDFIKDFCQNNKVTAISLVEGYGARLSAPGYMDCTDWTVCETEKEAKKYLSDVYDICPECGSDEEPCDCGT